MLMMSGRPQIPSRANMYKNIWVDTGRRRLLESWETIRRGCNLQCELSEVITWKGDRDELLWICSVWTSDENFNAYFGLRKMRTGKLAYAATRLNLL